jgi:hypothetical protein
LRVDLGDKNIGLLIKGLAELKKGCERGAFEAALKETDIGAVEIGSEGEFFLGHVSSFSGASEVLAKD